jgi:hypothetical protein
MIMSLWLVGGSNTALISPFVEAVWEAGKQKNALLCLFSLTRRNEALGCSWREGGVAAVTEDVWVEGDCEITFFGATAVIQTSSIKSYF